MIKNYRLRDYDFSLILLVLLITAIGIFAVGSARESLQNRQLIGAIAGCIIMIMVSLIDYHLIIKFYWVIYAINILLLVLVQIMGETKGGAQRWVNIGGIQFQPSETAKIFMILFYAAFIMRYQEKLNSPRYIILSIIFFLPILLLIYKQPDMSTSIIVCVLFCVILFVGGISWKLVLSVLAVAIPSIVIVLSLVIQPNQTLIKDYQQNRILAWLYPDEYASTEAYQQTNSVMAIGSGQLYGKGYKNNEVSSVKNGNFISEPQTDFIFAVIGEEFGFVGSVSVIALLIFIAFKCIIISRKSGDLAGGIIAAGMASLIAFQGFLNIGVATQVMPNTGIPLPFVSYGLTSLLSLYIGVGVTLNVRLQGKRPYNT